MSPSAVILAGGASSRFGGDKLTAPLRGRPVLEHALAAVAGIASRVVVVVGPDDPAPALAVPPGLDLAVARDAVAHRGPLAGLAAGLMALPREARDQPVLLLAGDMPAVVPAVLRRLADAVVADPALGIAHLEAEPVSALPAAVRPSIAGPAAEALLASDRRSLRGLLAAVPSTVIPAAEWRALDPAGDSLRDVDTPADLERG